MVDEQKQGYGKNNGADKVNRYPGTLNRNSRYGESVLDLHISRPLFPLPA